MDGSNGRGPEFNPPVIKKKKREIIVKHFVTDFEHTDIITLKDSIYLI